MGDVPCNVHTQYCFVKGWEGDAFCLISQAQEDAFTYTLLDCEKMGFGGILLSKIGWEPILSV